MASSTKQTVVKAGNAEAVVNTTVTDSLPAIPCPEQSGYTYVGARYVPIFADPIEWSSANTYEPLTIVTHEGDSYTSKTFVPTGIDISNTDYWAKTAGYNAQVEQYREEVKQWQGQINQANATSNSALNTANRAIKNVLTPIMLVFGDSYSQGQESSSPFWHEYVSRYMHSTVKNFAISGYGLLREGKTIRSEVQTAIADSSFNHDDVLYIYIMCGCNDYWNWVDTSNAYYNELKAINGLLKSNFPNASTVFVQNGWPYTSPEKDNVKVLEYSKQIQNSSSQIGMKYINLSDALNTNDALFQSENKHPTGSGALALAYGVINDCVFPSNYSVNDVFKGVNLEGLTVKSTSTIKVRDTVYNRGTMKIANTAFGENHYIRFSKNELTYCLSTLDGVLYVIKNNVLTPAGIILLAFGNPYLYIYVYDESIRSNSETEYHYFINFNI